MGIAALQTCLAFLRQCPSQKKGALLKHLASAEQNRLQSLPPTFQNLAEGTVSFDTFLDRLHFSHVASFLRSLSESEIRLFLAALSPEQTLKLKEHLLFSASLPQLTPLAHRFLRQKLIDILLEKVEEPLPLEALPESPMNSLLLLSHSELLRLIDFLGLHDLANETRQIIDTVKLKKIQGALKSDEQAYLKRLFHQKEGLGFKKMGLENWDGSAETLKSLLQQRGINRLAKAVYPQDPSFKWYLIHLLDVEQAHQLQKWMVPLDPPKAVSILIHQIADLISFLYPVVLK